MEFHPRPELKRDSITLLHGLWDYAIINKDEVKDAAEVNWQGKINVPYSPEAPLSGVNKRLLPSQELWYRLNFNYEDIEEDRLFLIAKAIDHSAEIFLNGISLLTHEGGYTPIECELTDYIKVGENTLCIKVLDPSDKGPYQRGKQTLKPHGMWYRCQSGIWQSIYLERRKKVHITSFRAETLEDLKHIRILITLSENKELPCFIQFNSTNQLLITGRENIIKVQNPHLWSPEDPYIYPITLTIGDDSVESYITMRYVSIENGRITLNGKTYFCNGILDQGYNSKGLYTFTPQEMLSDITLIKSLGFNTIRKHIKIEESYYYYLCDKIGLLVWQDMVSGGNPAFIVSTLPAVYQSFCLKDTKHKALFGRKDIKGRKEFEKNIEETVNALSFFNCIILWTLFNEGWGQYESARLTSYLRDLDPTRLIDSTSGWHDQGCGDFLSKHIYFSDYTYEKDKYNRAVILSEFGGVIYRIPGHVYNEKDFVYKRVESKEEYLNKLKDLFDNIRVQKEKGLTAAIYTQTSDVEEESNGFITYDREVVKAPIEKLKEIIFIQN